MKFSLPAICRALVAGSILLASPAGLAATRTVTFDATDCTANLQAAFDDPLADVVVIPFTGSPWKSGPLFLSRSDVVIHFEPGVEVVAKDGAFPSGRCLLQVQLCRNVTIRGYGATLRMRNGLDPAYSTNENRHCLALRGVSEVLVEGLTCTKAGGDGIYISGGWGGLDPTFSSLVTIQDCTLDDNRRQGISVISAQDLVVQRCVLSNTGATNGTDPMAGIDFEPNLPAERLVRCVLRYCSLFGNRATKYGTGVHTHLGNLGATSLPVSIQIERCHFTSTVGTGSAVHLSGPKDSGPPTTYTLTDCLIEDTRSSGLELNSGLATTTTQITRTVLRNTFTDIVAWNNGGTPIYLEGQSRNVAAYGNITFTDCLIMDSKPRSFIRSYEDRSGLPRTWCDGLRGNVTVINPQAAGHVYHLDANNDQRITLAVAARTSMPAQTVALSAPAPATSAGSATPAALAIFRSAADPSFPLAVSLAWSGSATNGSDYGYRPGFVILPPQTTSVTLPLTARTGGPAGAGKTVIATLTPRAAEYGVAGGGEAATAQLFATPLPAWRFNRFGDSADAGATANAANPAHDGLCNLLKYALGGDPHRAEAGSIQPVSALVAGERQFAFRCDTACTDLLYVVQASGDLTTWTDIATSLGGAAATAIAGSGATVSDPGVGQRTVIVTDVPEARRFLRLKVRTMTP